MSPEQNRGGGRHAQDGTGRVAAQDRGGSGRGPAAGAGWSTSPSRSSSRRWPSSWAPSA